MQLPSRWIVETVRARTGRAVTARELAEAAPGTVPGVVVIESFAAAIARDTTSASPSASSSSRPSSASAPTAADAAQHGLATENPTIARGLRTARARAESRFTEYDGVVGPRPGLLPNADRPLSPSRIESWAQCPFRYFLANLLRLRTREAPEAIDTIDPRTRGSLVHKVLEDFVQEMPARTSPDQPWTDAERARARAIAEEQCDAAEAAGQTGRPLLWQLERARIVREVSRTLDADERIRAERGLVTLATEVNFGREAEDPLPALTLDLDGASVTFRGQIDRIDASPDPDGPVVVYDYKTGSATGLQRARGRPGRCRAPRSSSRSTRSRSSRRSPAARCAPTTGTPRSRRARSCAASRSTTPGRGRARCSSTVAAGVAAGTFPAYSGKENPFFESFDECGFCDFDQLCSPDRERMFEAKRDDPVVSTFVELRGLGEDVSAETRRPTRPSASRRPRPTSGGR